MPSSNCSICKRPLTDPVSVRLGIGPVCRIQRKLDYMNEKTENMFENRSDYSYKIDYENNIIAITDNGGLKSVTNDIEKVIADIAMETQITGRTIIYKDSMGIWDGIEVTMEMKETKTEQIGTIKKIEFFPLTETQYEKAVEKVIKRRINPKDVDPIPY